MSETLSPGELTPEGYSIGAADLSRGGATEGNVRQRVARGAILNSAFQIGLYGVGTIERVLVATWLTREQYGLFGVLLAALVAIGWLKQAGIGDKYIQQSEPDQELAFQKAFTMELCMSLGFLVLATASLPLFALAYGRPEIVLPGILLATMIPITAFETPVWIPYRRMEYRRQRVLMAVDPISSAVLAIALAAAGLGYWGLIIGGVAGSLLGAVVCVATSPYPLRLRMDRPPLRAYTSFSWPLVGFGLCTFVIVQGTTFSANHAVGLAGVGVVGLAVNLSGMAEGVDTIVGQALYPAICAAAHRTELLVETFVKSNRIALMWAVPAMIGLALFAADLVHFVLGDHWRPAIPILIAVALTSALAQVGFNWSMFLRAVDNTRPIFIAALADVATFLCVAVPAILSFGLAGYAAGLATLTVVQVALRGWFMRRLFGGFSAIGQLYRSLLPSIPATLLVLAVRLVAPGHRSLIQALAELLLYVLASVASTVLLERALLRELWGYLRSSR
ncbi:MAG: oligosaccharide flippase family protein [Actinomycetota bacterium]|nr:oligosaccharide flippase family protein [Actinomycetota bacterium]